MTVTEIVVRAIVFILGLLAGPLILLFLAALRSMRQSRMVCGKYHYYYNSRRHGRIIEGECLIARHWIGPIIPWLPRNNYECKFSIDHAINPIESIWWAKLVARDNYIALFSFDRKALKSALFFIDVQDFRRTLDEITGIAALEGPHGPLALKFILCREKLSPAAASDRLKDFKSLPLRELISKEITSDTPAHRDVSS